MKTAMVGLSLFLLSVSVGCAGSRAIGKIAVGETRWESCFPGRAYSTEGAVQMKQMQAEGASLQEISQKVGGSRQDVRCAIARAQSPKPNQPVLIAAGSQVTK